MDLDKYIKWIRFRDNNIFTILTQWNEDKEEFKDQIEFINSIWSNVLLTNKGYNNDDLNNLLFTHRFILNSKLIAPDVYSSYGVESNMSNYGNIISSTSDGVTSVSNTIISGMSKLSLNDYEYTLTPYGLQYLNALRALQSFIVIL